MKTKKTFAYGIFAVILALSFITCDNGNNDTHTHDYGTAWKSNATQHWHECSCGEKTDIANHTGDPCAICGYASGLQNPDSCECNGKAEDCECDDCDCETCEEEIVIPSYTVTFDADNGNEPTTQTVTESSTVNKPADPSKTYSPIGLYLGTPPTACTFVEWQKSDGSAWNFTTDTVTADITLTAQWTSPSPIDITNETGNNIVEKAVSYVNANGGSEYTLVLGADVSSVAGGDSPTDNAGQWLNQDNTTLTITSNGTTERKISLGSNGWLLAVGGLSTAEHRNAILVIDGNITLEGKENNTRSLVYVCNGGNFYLKGNAKIIGNESDWRAAGVYVIRGTFTMEGGEISDNNTNGSWGSGVCVYIDGNFIMKAGAKITRNIGLDAPGVYVGSGSFIMEGGEISNNYNLSATNSFGGGVEVAGSFTMQGGVIFGNVCSDDSSYYSYSRAGGVYIRNTNYDGPAITFTKTGGTIYGHIDGDDMSNTVKDGNGTIKIGKGHAVYVNDTYFRDTTVGQNDSISIVSYGNGTTESATGQWTD